MLYRQGYLGIAALLLLLLITPPIQGATVKYDLTVSKAATTPDGVVKPCTLQYNHQYPGPPIYAALNDFLSVNVWNNLSDPTSVHWHGMFQNGTQFQDGPAMITQCPIQPGQSQHYFFQVRQTGTYWYHAHYDSQYTDGLVGPLIMKDPSDPEYYGYDASSEIIIVISDWYRWGYKINDILHNRTGLPPLPHSALINGRGQFPCMVTYVEETLADLGLNHKEFIGTKECDIRKQSRSLFYIKPGSTVRIRVINASAMSGFTFSIDSHKLIPIEVDGVSVARNAGKAVDYAYMGAAQRYSFLVRMDQPLPGGAKEATHTIRALIDTESFPKSDRFPTLNLNAKWTLQPQATAGLVYSDSKTDATPHEDWEQFSYIQATAVPQNVIPPGGGTGKWLNELSLLPRDEEDAPTKLDLEFKLVISLFPAPAFYSLFNESKIKLPEDWEEPLLFDLVRGKDLKKSNNPLYIGHNQAAQIVIENTEPFAHPLHLHGNTFWVVGKGKGLDGPFIPEVHGPSLNASTVKRDTAVVNAKSWMVIRLVGDNPGVWMFHCHLDWHNAGGMAMTIVVAKEQLVGLRIPNETQRVCRQRKLKI